MGDEPCLRLLQWQPEAQKYAPNVPLLLVGTKTDLRDNEDVRQGLRNLNKEPVSYEEGLRIADSISAKYLECSTILQLNVKNVFEEAANLGKGNGES